MESLPVELVIQILGYSLAVHPVPSSILRVASSWREIGQTILHTNIEISSLTQLYHFRTSKLSCKPRSFALRLAGGAVDFTRQLPTSWTASLDEPVEVHNEDIRNRVSMSGGIFGCLRLAFAHCPDVEAVHLRLNSHTNDPHIEMIYSALCLINPRIFEWAGPDPEYHWSTAIVTRAAEPLVRAIRGWANLEDLSLRNVHFPQPPCQTSFVGAFMFHRHPHLQRVTIGQAVFLSPTTVTAMVIAVPSLQELVLEDAYLGSIWERRVRAEEIMENVRHLDKDHPHRIRVTTVVHCHTKLERTIGGDQADF